MDFGSERIVQSILKSAEPQVKKQRLPLKDIKAYEAMRDCRTEALGISYFQCPERHEIRQQPHSCRHRSCTLCSRRSQRVWVEQQQRRLLDCGHYHLVFTLPHEYLPLWYYNRAWFASAMFSVTRSVLMELMTDPAHHGLTPGLVMVLHTWGRQLNLHPHVHCLMTAGGLDQQDQWQDIGEFLLPVKLVKKLYRGRFQAAIDKAFEASELGLPPSMSRGAFRSLYRTAFRKEWSVRIQDRYEYGRGVMLYLSRYLKGGPLKPGQISYCDHKQVAFRYRDHRTQRVQELPLTREEFIRRLFLHVPEPGQHTVRHYGLYASACRLKRNRCRSELGTLEAYEHSCGTAEADLVLLKCRHCGGRMQHVRSVRTRYQKGISYKGGSKRTSVQQVDETEAANALRTKDLCVMEV